MSTENHIYNTKRGGLPMNEKRKSGILLHPTSLPGKYGIGTLGREAYRFVDFLIVSRQSLWQVCPLGHTGYGDSPYQCFSAFAGNPLLIDLECLVLRGFLTMNDIEEHSFTSEKVDYGKVIEWKFPILKKAFERFKCEKKVRENAKFQNFIFKNKDWLDDYALFMSLKDKFGGKAWFTWDEDIRLRKHDALEHYKKELADEIMFYQFLQYIFSEQWLELKAYANRNFIQIIGDIPLYIAADSSDAWASPELFLLDDKTGLPQKVAGVPPDYFSATGQLWGNPIYRWDYMKSNGFKWWIKRIEANLHWADILRLDHFRGLCAFWQVPYGEETAINGEWKQAPGNELFEALQKTFGNIPILAEDLGVITEDVVALREKYNLPGMKILQFAFDSEEASSKTFFPHVYDKNCAVYTGTHDNDTVHGWYNAAKDIDKKMADKYLGIKNKDMLHYDFIRAAWASTANIAVAPMQDLLGKGSEARMNLPGSASGNWQWRFKWDDLTSEHEEFLAEITALYGRL